MKIKTSLLIVGLVMLSALAVFATPVVADGEINLWVVPEHPDRYDGPSETTVDDVTMGTTFSADVLILNHHTTTAQDVYLKLWVSDASNIESITIGKAEKVEPGIDPFPKSTIPNDGADISIGTFDAPIHEHIESIPSGPYHDGYSVSYLIGDIPWHDNNDAVGNPQDDLLTFNPDAGVVYIRVPFTVNFYNPPEAGFTVYFYAENPDTNVKTAFSHDAGYGQIPEFTTIAIPVAAVLGLLFFFNHRKRRNN
jgi:hypothetical protein